MQRELLLLEDKTLAYAQIWALMFHDELKMLVSLLGEQLEKSRRCCSLHMNQGLGLVRSTFRIFYASIH